VQSFDRVDPGVIGFDAAVEFPPNNTALAPITARQRLLNSDFRGDVYDWRELARQSMAQSQPHYLRYPGVNSGWDNEPRRSGGGRVFAHASPRGYRDWLRHAISVATSNQSEPLVFINAWNEWAEGAVLEPDSRLGHAWLEATRAGLVRAPAADNRPCTVLHVWHPELLSEFIAALRASGINWRVIITTAPQQEDAVRTRLIGLDFEAMVEVFENRGQDILPFLHVADRLLNEGVTTVLKLHDRRPIHRQRGELWRNELLELLAPERAARLLVAFRDDAKLGLVHAKSQFQPLECDWDANKANIEYLTRRLGTPPPDVEPDNLIIDGVLWLRLAALRPLLDAHLGVEEFEFETSLRDGTLAHAVHRMVAPIATAGGFRTANAASLLGLAEAGP
jgi:lipopolysaccharide biosynthesis protein